jgi:hypothetical protein
MSAGDGQPLRVAMWSGPRNISTAMMRSWENRGDCAVSDEPLYAAYLAATGLDHPGREQIIAHGDTDFERVAAALSTGPAPGGQPIWYQKHMTHHLLPGHDSDWVRSLVNVFLIREPAEVVESYLKSRATIEPADIGLLQQAALFEQVADSLGRAPPVIDADDFLREPGAYLQALCEQLGIAFTERMLAWPAGPRESDGIWAPYWYDAVWKSTGFEPWRARSPRLSGHALDVAEACRPAYETLRAHRLVLPSPA